MQLLGHGDEIAQLARLHSLHMLRVGAARAAPRRSQSA
jgi:hypothetical protein